jgi:hypothetical protein
VRFSAGHEMRGVTYVMSIIQISYYLKFLFTAFVIGFFRLRECVESSEIVQYKSEEILLILG